VRGVLQCLLDSLEYPFKILLNIRIPKPKNLVPLRMQIFLTTPILCFLLHVVSTVYLKDEFLFCAVEVNDVPTNGDLTSKFIPKELTVSQPCPHLHFLWCLLLTQLASNDCIWCLYHTSHLTCPAAAGHPLPQRWRGRYLNPPLPRSADPLLPEEREY